MSPNIVACILVLGSIGLGAAISYFAFGMKLVFRVAFMWACIVVIAFLGHIFILIVATIIFTVYIREAPNEAKLLYFVALLPAMPVEGYSLPFPGLQYLWNLSFLRLMILCLLAPLFFNYVNSAVKRGAYLNVTDTFFILFLLLKILLVVRLDSVTNMARAAFTLFVDFGIPYFAISRFLLSPGSLHWMLSVFLIGAMFISFVSIIETLKSWRIYGPMLDQMNLNYDPQMLVPWARSGRARAAGGSMFQPLAYAYFVAMAMLVCFYYWRHKFIRFVPMLMMMSVFSVGLLFTGSRGGLLIFIVGLYVLFYMRLNSMMKMFLGGATAAAVIGGIVYFSIFGFAGVDGAEGSFEYRRLLIINSLNAVSQNLLLGSNDYTSNAYLARSLQGQGIIDVTNMYLQIALDNGIIGVFLFLGMFVSLIKAVWDKQGVTGFDHKDLMLALIVMTMVFIGTCSDVSFVPWYTFLVVALARAYVGFQAVPAAHRSQQQLAY